MRLEFCITNLIVYFCAINNVFSAGLEKPSISSDIYTDSVFLQNKNQNDSLDSYKRFTNQYIMALLDDSRFADTLKKYSYSTERIGLLKFASLITAGGYIDAFRSNKLIAKDIESVINKKLELLGILGTKISPQVLISLEGIAKKYWSKDINLLTLLAVWLKTMSLELAITIKENANGQCVVGTVDLSVVRVCNQSIDELVKSIYSISKRLIDLALKNCSKKQFDSIRDIQNNLFVNSKSMKNDNIVSYKLDKYKKSNDLKLVNQKDIERAIKYLKRSKVITKDNEQAIEQMFYMANNDSIKLKDKIEFLSEESNAGRKINLVSSNLLDSYYKKSSNMDSIAKNIELLGLDQFLELLSDDYALNKNFKKSIKGSNRQKSILKVYKGITLDMLVSMPYIVNQVLNNSSLDSSDKDRVIAVIGGVCALCLETIRSLTERLKKGDSVFANLYSESDAHINVILDSLIKTIKELKNMANDKSRYYQFVESLLKLAISTKGRLQKMMEESLANDTSVGYSGLDEGEEKIMSNLINKVKDFRSVLGVGNIMGKIKNEKKIVNKFVRSAINK